MINRILIYFKDQGRIDNLLSYAKLLKEKFNIEVDGLYVKDIKKYEVIPSGMEGIMVDNSANYLIEEWEKIESKKVKEIKSKFIKDFKASNFISREGIIEDVLKEELRGYDLVLVANDNKLGNITKNILRTHIKPVILVPNKTEFKLENVLFVNDLEKNANKSFFEFIKIFHQVNKINILSLNLEKDEPLSDYMVKTKFKYEFLTRDGDEMEEVEKELEKNDMLIMGNLRHSFMMEKIRGKLGIKLLKEIEKPIFIS
ncbi:MAG: hypothetical protein ACQERZ_07925 [Fusobacteriota bacterium]